MLSRSNINEYQRCKWWKTSGYRTWNRHHSGRVHVVPLLFIYFANIITNILLGKDFGFGLYDMDWFCCWQITKWYINHLWYLAILLFGNNSFNESFLNFVYKLLFSIWKGLLWTFCYVHACYIQGDFVTFVTDHMTLMVDQGILEFSYKPIAIYDKIMFWISLNFGIASDIQYTRDNHP